MKRWTGVAWAVVLLVGLMPLAAAAAEVTRVSAFPATWDVSIDVAPIAGNDYRITWTIRDADGNPVTGITVWYASYSVVPSVNFDGTLESWEPPESSKIEVVDFTLNPGPVDGVYVTEIALSRPGDYLFHMAGQVGGDLFSVRAEIRFP